MISTTTSITSTTNPTTYGYSTMCSVTVPPASSGTDRTMTGTVTEYAFTNPHVQIHIDVTNESGEVEKWVAETASPQRLFGFGWNAKTLKVGDKVTVTGAPLKDGHKIITIIKLVGGNAPVLTEGSTE